MADVTILSGGGAKPSGIVNTVRFRNIQADLSVEPGDPIVLLDEIALSDASAAATANCAGIAVSAGEESTNGTAGGYIDVQYAGPCTLTTAQWDRVTGGSGGLTPHAVYFVSPTTAGRLTTTDPEPLGDYATKVGFALNATTMMLQITPTKAPPA